MMHGPALRRDNANLRLIFVQAAHTLYLQLYTWNRPSSGSRAPVEFISPRLSFTVMLPARHEEDVIAGTIERVARADYPADLIQILVICSVDDQGTISAAAGEDQGAAAARAEQRQRRGVR